VISLELAKKLEEAGLEWEPKRGDFCWSENCEGNNGKICLIKADNVGFYGDRIYTWLPSLSQLLAEIEGRGREWDLEFDIGGCHKYSCAISNDTDYEFITADTPEEAAGKALLWVLERGQNNVL
jgi:hypothetical protein